MQKTRVRKLKILKTQSITPNMKRLTLGGDELTDFPLDQEGVYLKLVFPLNLNLNLNLKPLVRTYTVIQQRSECNEIDIDFVLHPEPHGPASMLAIESQEGDEVLLSGPGKKKDLFTDADWFFIAGDMTALPAISVILKNLPKETRGHLVIQLIDKDDQQNLIIPDNMEVHWITGSETELNDKVRSLPFLEGKPSVWVACEFSVMRLLRKYFKNEKMIDKDALYISSYWKKGLTEDKHKVVKREDSSTQIQNSGNQL